MKLKELIKELEEIEQRLGGDIEVACSSGDYPGTVEHIAIETERATYYPPPPYIKIST